MAAIDEQVLERLRKLAEQRQVAAVSILLADDPVAEARRLAERGDVVAKAVTRG